MSLGIPLPTPVPTRPPSASEKSDWTICRPEPDGSAKGSSQVDTRTCTWPKMSHMQNDPMAASARAQNT